MNVYEWKKKRKKEERRNGRKLTTKKKKTQIERWRKELLMEERKVSR